jgi:hypothetical protein
MAPERYLVFMWDRYYPHGGMNDLYDSFDDEDDALECGENLIDGTSDKNVSIYDMAVGYEIKYFSSFTK